jgi:hypothetical protein
VKWNVHDCRYGEVTIKKMQPRPIRNTDPVLELKERKKSYTVYYSAVVQFVEVLSYKPMDVGSIPDGVIGIFH